MINDLISLLDETEQEQFVDYLERRNKRHDTRNIALFKALLNGEQEFISIEIGSNAYNVLKKRLTDRLLDFISSRTLESEATQEILVIKHLLVARKLMRYGKFKNGFKLLKKIEQAAKGLEHYSILNEIYHTQIEFSDHELADDLEVVFRKLEQNTSSFLEQERLNTVYAIVKKAFKRISGDNEPINIDEILAENYEKYGVSNEIGYSFKSLYQLAMIADIAGTKRNDYHSLNVFFADRIADLKGGEADNERSLIYHIDVLYSIANIYFRKKQFELSRTYLSEMMLQMNRFNRKLYDLRYPKYATLEALNLNFLGDHVGAAAHIDALIHGGYAETDLLLNARLTRAMIYFQQGDLGNAKTMLATLNDSDTFYMREAGLEWLLNYKYLEILLHIELGNTDYVDSRIASLTRKFRSELKLPENAQIIPFLKLVKELESTPERAKTEEFQQKVETTFDWRPREEEDLLRMSFYAWLKSKMEGSKLYETTLQLVKNVSSV